MFKEIQIRTDSYWQVDTAVHKLKDHLIQEHIELSPLDGIPIKLLYTNKSLRRQGRRVPTQAKCFGSELQQMLTPYRFAILLNEFDWDSRPDLQEARLFEALYACEVFRAESGSLLFGIRRPDFTGYAVVHEKYPCLAEGAQQLSLLTPALPEEPIHAAS